jgi:hypothetical protein
MTPKTQARKVDALLTSNYERSLLRPHNYESLSAERQWEIDKELGILDWDGRDDRIHGKRGATGGATRITAVDG